MKVTALIFSIFLSVSVFANDDNDLAVYQDGLIVEVVNFKEGDKLKLFELETGDHILSKTYARVDLTQLPIGSYVLENNEGKSIVIDRLEEQLMVDGAIIVQEEDFVVEKDSEFLEETEENVADAIPHSNTAVVSTKKNLLSIQREGNTVTVLDFEKGDKLKLFEVKDLIHVLSKTTNVIDLSQLPTGQYVLENSKGDSVIIEKFTEEQNNLTNL